MPSVLSFFFSLLFFPSMVGLTVDPRAEPVPEIHSIEKVSKTIRGGK